VPAAANAAKASDLSHGLQVHLALDAFTNTRQLIGRESLDVYTGEGSGEYGDTGCSFKLNLAAEGGFGGDADEAGGVETTFDGGDDGLCRVDVV